MNCLTFADRACRPARGFSLLEVMAALVIASFAMVGVSYWANEAAEDARTAVIANYVSEFNAAATRYVNVNYATLSIGTLPQTFPASTLASYLPPNFNTTSPLAQTPCLLVQSDGAGGIRAIAVMASAAGALPRIETRFVPQIAMQAGPNVGWVNSLTNGGLPRAASGAWNMTAAEFNAIKTPGCGGQLRTDDIVTMLTQQGIGITPGSATSFALYRNQVPGHDELNTMGTTLHMGGNSIDQVDTLRGIGAQLSGLLHAAQAQIAGLLTADGVSANRVTATTSLSAPVIETAQINGSKVTFSNDVQVNGSLHANGAVSAPTVTATTVIANDVNAYGSVNVPTGTVTANNIVANDVRSYGNVAAANQLSAPQVQLDAAGAVPEFSSCATMPHGAIRLLAGGTGRIATCINGQWKSVSELGNASLTTNGYQWIGGLLMQWGWTPQQGDAVTQAFNVPFPNGCFYASVSAERAIHGDMGFNHVGACTRTWFQFTSEFGSGDPSLSGTRWFAIGY